MKIDKKKLVFASIVGTVLLFLVGYTYLIIGTEDNENKQLQKPEVPELRDQEKQYPTKLDAVNDNKEKREANAPSLYNEKLVDSLGKNDIERQQNERRRKADSIFRQRVREDSVQTVAERFSRYSGNRTKAGSQNVDKVEKEVTSRTIQELALEHQLFFSSNPGRTGSMKEALGEFSIPVEVDGEQKVKANSRLQMRIIKDVQIGNLFFPKDGLVFGFVSFKPNRVLISIENIDLKPIQLKAFDLEDGSEGIYVENTFRAEASEELANNVVQDIQIPGTPQIRGIKQVFQRTNRNVKVTVRNNYKLLLKFKTNSH